MFLVLSACCCALVSVLARDVLASRAAGFLAPAVFLTFPEFLDLASNGPREKTVMVLFLLGALILAGRRHWVLAGVSTALATLTWQPVLAVAVAGAAVLVAALPERRLRAAAGFVAGGLLTLGATVAAYAASGDLRTAVGGFVLVNLEDKQQPSVFSAPAATWRLLERGYGASIWLVLLGLVAVVVLAVRVRSARLLALAAATLAGTAWTASAINGAPDLFELLPLGAVGVAGAGLAATRHLPVRAGRVLLVGATAAAVLAAGVTSVTTRSDLLDQERADVAAVLAAGPADASVLSIDAPEVLALAGRRNPTGLQLFDPAMEHYLDTHRPGGMAGYAREVERLHPTFIVVGRHYERAWPLALLERDYREVGRGTAWTWYLARSAGPAALAACITANRRAMGG
nr:DolP-mannose mannosyltransferase [Nocardioides luti]